MLFGNKRRIKFCTVPKGELEEFRLPSSADRSSLSPHNNGMFPFHGDGNTVYDLVVGSVEYNNLYVRIGDGIVRLSDVNVACFRKNTHFFSLCHKRTDFGVGAQIVVFAYHRFFVGPDTHIAVSRRTDGIFLHKVEHHVIRRQILGNLLHADDHRRVFIPDLGIPPVKIGFFFERFFQIPDPGFFLDPSGYRCFVFFHGGAHCSSDKHILSD